AAGHEVGNPTLRHQKLHFRGPRRIREELERTHELIVDTTGRVPRSFRAPHGYRNPFVGRVTRRLGYTVFGWTFGVWDSDPRVAAEQIRARVRGKLRPGAIILLHDGDGYDPHGDRSRTAAALPGIIAEALALALFLVMAPSLLQLEPWLRVLQVGVGLALVVVLLLAWARGWSWLAEQLPPRLGARLAVLRTMGRGGRLLLPTLFALYNWATQWAPYHLVLRATHVPVSLAASFPALIAANLSGRLRPPPANVGVTQAALVVGLLPFGVAPEQAVSAGLALQGLQVLPVLFLGA